MGLEMVAVQAGPAVAAAERPQEQQVVEIYPLSRYYFGAKDARPRPAVCETAADRALRLKANFAAHGLRTCVHGVLLVELSGHPHVLLLQVRNSSFLLPGGRLGPAEQDIQGLKRKLSSKLSGADPRNRALLSSSSSGDRSKVLCRCMVRSYLEYRICCTSSPSTLYGTEEEEEEVLCLTILD